MSKSTFSTNNPHADISQPQPVTALSRLAASHHWRTWWVLLLQQSLCQTLCTLNWLIAYVADCKRTNQKTGLKFWATNANKCPLLAPLAQDLLSVCLRHTWDVCSQYVESWQRAREIS